MTHRPLWIIYYASAIHALWLVAVILDSSALNATGLAALLNAFGSRPAVAVALAVSTSLALTGLYRPCENRFARIAMLMPQQFLLVLSAGGAAQAIFSGHFADGVLRPVAFIFADQLHYVLKAAFHTGAIYDAGGRA